MFGSKGINEAVNREGAKQEIKKSKDQQENFWT